MRCWLHRGALALRAHAPLIRARGTARAMNAAAALNANALVDEYGDMSGNSGETHVLSDLKLECGQVLHQVPCRYKTWGALNEAKDNVILVAHAFTVIFFLLLVFGVLAFAQGVDRHVGIGTQYGKTLCFDQAAHGAVAQGVAAAAAEVLHVEEDAGFKHGALFFLVRYDAPRTIRVQAERDVLWSTAT